MNETVKKDFDGFLMQELSYHNYLNLFSKIDESPKMTTLIRREPAKGELKHLLILSRILAEDSNLKTACEWFDYLREGFGFGNDAITIDEATTARAGLETEIPA